MSLEVLRETVARFSGAATALTAVGAALAARTGSPLVDPVLASAVNAVLDALGVRSTIDELAPGELRVIAAEIRTFALHNARLLSDAGQTEPGPRWSHTDTTLLQAAGDVSVGFAVALERTIAPRLEGLSARLGAPGAAFLDIGTGVAALSIQMLRQWPQLHVVGIDPWAPALDRARHNVQAANLADRIDLRLQTAQELTDVDRFDLVWIPGLFLDQAAIDAAFTAGHRALRAGGWVLLALSRPAVDPLAAAVASFRTAALGGFALPPARAEERLREVGFVDVQTLPGSPTSVTVLIAARRR